MKGFERKKTRRERGGGLRGGRGGGRGEPGRPEGAPREAPGRPQSDPRGGPARPQELPRDPSILQEMKFIENHMFFIDFHRLRVAEAQDDASSEAINWVLVNNLARLAQPGLVGPAARLAWLAWVGRYPQFSVILLGGQFGLKLSKMIQN